jgi:AcrR family transcriptional regulator
MAAEPLTRDRVLDAAEDTLRRFGPAKTTVLDVARALGVSHGTVYRHFTSKAALRDAVLHRWLERMNPPLEAVASADGPAADRLRRWLKKMMELKQGRARDDADLFEAYTQMAAEARAVVQAHVADLTRQLERIVADGMASGEFARGDAAATARAVFDATARYHHPAHAGEWAAAAGVEASFDAVWRLLLLGLKER